MQLNLNIRFVHHLEPMVNLWEKIQSEGSSYLLSQLVSHAISFEGHRHVHSVGCNVSMRLMTLFREQKSILLIRWKLLGIASTWAWLQSQLKSQAEALKGGVQKEGACRHGELKKTNCF